MLQGRREDERAGNGRADITEAVWLIHDRLFGFLLGATASGAGMYYYVIDEYRVSNQLLTEDIYVRHSTLYYLRVIAREGRLHNGYVHKANHD
jgi:hypothetical protein